MDNNIIKWISEVQAIAQNGLTFANNEFDKERYARLRHISFELAANISTYSVNTIENLFCHEMGYATPKLDVRAFILKDNQLLLVKERSDGLWTLPGGFADVNESPAESVVRETLEESGYTVKPIKLLALWDKFKHDHPMQLPHIYKCFFHCEITGGSALENIEIAEIDFFDIAKLPDLSIHRVTQKQILSLYQMVLNPGPTVFD